jgi:hypothetical protein
MTSWTGVAGGAHHLPANGGYCTGGCWKYRTDGGTGQRGQNGEPAGQPGQAGQDFTDPASR